MLEPGAEQASQGLFAKAVAHHRAGDLDDAAQGYLRLLAVQPGHARAISNLGVILLDQGRAEDAVACHRQAIALNPDFPDAVANLGTALQRLGRLREAEACYRHAIELSPGFAEPHYNLGIVLRGQGRLDAAVASYRRALDLRPDHAEAHNNLGIALQQQGRLGEAACCYHQAVSLRPGNADAHNNLGSVLQQAGQLDGAVACYRAAIALRSDHADAYCNLGLALLKCGAFADGWAAYEWRWQTPEWAGKCRAFQQPQWRGETRPGQTLLIHAEQGYGDTIQFCRYAALAAASGLHVVMEVQRPLIRLLQSLAGVEQLVAQGDALPAFDMHCPMLAMPAVLGTTPATIPFAQAYLHADAASIETWRMRLGQADCPRVGLVWAGSASLASDGRRSLDPGRLAPLFEMPGVQFVSLQKGGPRAPRHFPLRDPTASLDEFADTAALIANLDLVISVDTATAHLAAALGCPVWLLDRFDNDWRWLTRRRDSPWYPSLRLFRQPSPGDWGSVLAEICRELACFSPPPRGAERGARASPPGP